MKRITVFLRSKWRLGDQLVAYPTLYQLKTFWPDAEIEVVARDQCAKHYVHLPWVSRFTYADNFMTQVGAARHSDLALCLHESSERYSLATTLGLSASRLGFRNGRLFDRLWTHSCMKNSEEYIAFSNLRLLSAHTMFDLPSAMRGSFEQLARMCTPPVMGADVAMIPGGGAGTFKRWPIEKYFRLADLLTRRLGDHVRFTFYLGPQEERERELISASNRPNFHIAWCQSVGEIAAGLAQARLIVANDCGPSHIAQCLSRPYVGVFNEPNPHWFWTRHGAQSVTPDNRTSDITSITPERVLVACNIVLSTADPLRGWSGAADDHPCIELALPNFVARSNAPARNSDPSSFR